MLISKSGTEEIQDYSERKSVMVSHAIAWAAITTSVCKVSYDLQIRRGIVVHAFYNIFENGKK